MTSIRCDKPMRRSKERAGRYGEQGDMRGFECTGRCYACICGMVKLQDGTWEHIRMTSVKKQENA